MASVCDLFCITDSLLKTKISYYITGVTDNRAYSLALYDKHR
jgi:hypothetical protein